MRYVRPLKRGGPKLQREILPSYQARLRMAGKVARFDPAKQMIIDQDVFADMRDKFHNAMLKLELCEQDVARLSRRNTYLEAELKLRMQLHTNAVKENFMFKQILGQQKPTKR
jgi:hypothetical protein